MKKILFLLLTTLLSSMNHSSWALSLGEITSHVSLGKPLNAVLDIQSDKPLKLHSDCIQAHVFYGEKQINSDQVNLKLENSFYNLQDDSSNHFDDLRYSDELNHIDEQFEKNKIEKNKMDHVVNNYHYKLHIRSTILLDELFMSLSLRIGCQNIYKRNYILLTNTDDHFIKQKETLLIADAKKSIENKNKNNKSVNVNLNQNLVSKVNNLEKNSIKLNDLNQIKKVDFTKSENAEFNSVQFNENVNSSMDFNLNSLNQNLINADFKIDEEKTEAQSLRLTHELISQDNENQDENKNSLDLIDSMSEKDKKQMLLIWDAMKMPVNEIIQNTHRIQFLESENQSLHLENKNIQNQLFGLMEKANRLNPNKGFYFLYFVLFIVILILFHLFYKNRKFQNQEKPYFFEYSELKENILNHLNFVKKVQNESENIIKSNETPEIKITNKIQKSNHLNALSNVEYKNKNKEVNSKAKKQVNQLNKNKLNKNNNKNQNNQNQPHKKTKDDIEEIKDEKIISAYFPELNHDDLKNNK